MTKAFSKRTNFQQPLRLLISLILTVGLFATRDALAIPIGEQIINGGFSANLTSWTTSGTVSARASGDVINTAGGNAGFDNFFGSSFAVLGDSTGDIGGSEDSGTHFISQTFSLPVISGTYDLTLSFNSVFDGDDRDNINQIDIFRVLLNSTELFAQNSFPLPNCGPGNSPTCSNSQLIQNPFSQTILGLPGGSYTLKFELAENNNAQSNTAVGIDNVSISGQSNVPAASVPEPSSLIFLASGLGGVLVFLKRRG
jgi:hypothetical protein